jgi:hypothetical protein
MENIGRRTFIAGAVAMTAGMKAAGSASAATTTAAPVLTEQELEDVLTSLDEHFAQRASLATKNPIRASSDGRFALSYRRAYADKQSAIANHARAIAGTHAGYSHASSNVQLVSSQQASDGSVELTVQEVTTLAFAKVIDPGSDYMSYAAKHVVTLTRSQGAWIIHAIAFQPEYKAFIPITQLPDDVPAGTPDHPVGAASGFTPPTLPPPSQQGPQVIKGTAQLAAGYDYSAMVQYAANWYNRYNPTFPQYNDDCTNFVSQCLHAGGWQLAYSAGIFNYGNDHNWFYAGLATGFHDVLTRNTHSWGGAQNLRNFAYLSGRAYDLSSASYLGPGDILGYDFGRDGGDRRVGTLDHMQLACANHGGNPLMAQHSDPYFGRPLSEIMAQPGAGGWRLWPQRT